MARAQLAKLASLFLVTAGAGPVCAADLFAPFEGFYAGVLGSASTSLVNPAPFGSAIVRAGYRHGLADTFGVGLHAEFHILPLPTNVSYLWGAWVSADYLIAPSLDLFIEAGGLAVGGPIQNLTGWQVGVGADYALTENLHLLSDVIYREFSNGDRHQALRAGAAFKF